MENKRKRIWGIEYEDIFSDDYRIRKIYIKNPFFEDGKYRVGINQKLLKQTRDEGIDKFIIQVGQREISMYVPNEKDIKEKEKKKEFEDIPSLFSESKPLRIYYFII